MQIPNAMPTLSKGAHKPGQGKACVMEYVALLAGEEWSDNPSCTNLHLATCAITANDHLRDYDRHLLVPFIGRLFGTDQAVSWQNTLLYEYIHNMPEFQRWDRFVSAGCTCDLCVESRGVERLTYNETRDLVLTILTKALDKYDELVERTEAREVTDDDLATLAAAVTG